MVESKSTKLIITDELDLQPYNCPLCMSVVRTPVRISVCGMLFCQDCLNNFIHAQKEKGKLNCPMCRIEFKETQVAAAKDVQKSLTTISYKCKCGKSILLADYTSHVESGGCQAHQAELQEAIAKVAVKPEDVKKTVNRSTFACPLCSEKNLERKGLLEHVRKKHKGKPAVCPICVVQAYGDPNYVSQNLSAHLDLRHKFDLDTVAQNDEGDDAQLNEAILRSLGLK